MLLLQGEKLVHWTSKGAALEALHARQKLTSTSEPHLKASTAADESLSRSDPEDAGLPGLKQSADQEIKGPIHQFRMAQQYWRIWNVPKRSKKALLPWTSGACTACILSLPPQYRLTRETYAIRLNTVRG